MAANNAQSIDPADGRWPRIKMAINAVFMLCLLASIVPVLWLSYSDRQATAGKVVLRFMYWGGPEQLEQEREVREAFLAKMREEGRDDIELELIPANTRYDTKLKAMMSADETPDVFMVAAAMIARFSDREKPLIADITDLVAADRQAEQSMPRRQRQLDFDDLLPQAVRTFYCNGRLYGFPRDYKCSGVGYNADMLADAGLEDPNDLYDRNEWTWEKFEEYLRALHGRPNGRGGTIIGLFQDNFSEGYWANIMLQAGGGIWSDDGRELIADRPESIRGLQFVYDLAWTHRLAKEYSAEMGQANPWAFGETAMLGIRGWHVPGYIRQTYNISENRFSFAWDVAPWPLGPELHEPPEAVRTPAGELVGWRLTSGRVVLPDAVHWVSGEPGRPPFRLRQCTATSVGYVMSSTTRNRPEAWRLLKFLVGPEAQTIRAGFRLKTANGEVVIAGPNMPSRKSLEADYLAMARNRSVRPTFTGSLEHKNRQDLWPRIDVFLSSRLTGRPSTGAINQDEIGRYLDRQFQRMLMDPSVRPEEVVRETRARAVNVYNRLRYDFPNSFNTPHLVRPPEEDPLGLAR